MQKIIVIEGTDGSGKQTQTQMLYEKLKGLGKNVFIQSFPNYKSPSSEPIKMYLGGELGDDPNALNAYEASILFAVDRMLTMKQLKQTLPDDAIILLDRYVQSNMIHQACKINNSVVRNQFYEWLYDFEFNLLALPEPNVVFFLDMPAKDSASLASARGEYKSGIQKDIHEKNFAYLEKAYKIGKAVAGQFNWTIIECLNEQGNIRTADEIDEEIFKQVKKLKLI